MSIAVTTLEGYYKKSNLPIHISCSPFEVQFGDQFSYSNPEQAANLANHYDREFNAIRTQRTFVECDLYHFPSDDPPLKVPTLFPRDNFNWEERQKTWQNRIKMCETAIATRGIFSLSIQVTSPSQEQNWYLQKRFQIQPYAVREHVHNPSLSNPVLAGFIRPFPGYRSEAYQPDPNMEHLIPSTSDELLEIKSKELRESLLEILTYFENDAESIGLALIYYDLDQSDGQKIKRKFFEKV